MRLALGGGAIAALSVMTVGLVPPPGAPPSDPAPVQVALADSRTRRVEPRIRYVQLRPGQKAPPGARVIDAAAPTPRIVVQRPTTTTPTVRRVTRTRQSGR